MGPKPKCVVCISSHVSGEIPAQIDPAGHVLAALALTEIYGQQAMVMALCPGHRTALGKVVAEFGRQGISATEEHPS